MTDFNIRSDAVDVEQIMKQIRARLQEKRGVDYTEEQIRELAAVRLERFLDPRNLRSDLLEEFRKSRPAPPVIPTQPPPVEPPYAFDDQTLFTSHRGIVRLMRRLLRPALKLFFNPNTLNQILHTQAEFNVDVLKRDQRRKIEMQIFDRSRAEWNVLYYEVLHNLVLETTRNAVELKNLKMRLEALASRLDFSERRVRALEGVVQYRPEVVRSRDRTRGPSGHPEHDEPLDEAGAIAGSDAETAGPVASLTNGARRRRRRRRGRRGAGLPVGAPPGGFAAAPPAEVAGDTADEPDETDAGAADVSASPGARSDTARAPGTETNAETRRSGGHDADERDGYAQPPQGREQP